MNDDGAVNGLDVDPFVEVLLVAGLAATADMNADGSVNGLDVDPFVVLVLGEHASTEAAGMGVAQHGRPVASATYDGMLAGMSIGSTLRRVHRTRPSHDAYQYGDPTHLIQHRAIEQIFARRSRMVTRIRGDGQRSPPADMIHDAQRVAAGRWHLAVDRAMRQDTDWDRFA